VCERRSMAEDGILGKPVENITEGVSSSLIGVLAPALVYVVKQSSRAYRVINTEVRDSGKKKSRTKVGYTPRGSFDLCRRRAIVRNGRI